MKADIWKLLTVLLLAGGAIFYFYFVKPDADSVNMNLNAKPEVVKIAWIGPLTGPSSAFGIDSLKAAELAIIEYQLTKGKHDPEIHLVVGDDSYDPEKTKHEYEKIIKFDHPQALLMLTYSGVPKIAKNALEDSIIVMDTLDNDLNLAGLNSNIFLIAKETEEVAGIYAEKIIENNHGNVFILFNRKDGFMNWLGNTLAQILRTSGIKNTLVGYDPAEPNFNDLLQKAKTDNADGYVFFGHNEIAPAIKIAREMGITAQFYASSIVPDPDFQEISKGASDSIYIVYFGPLEGNRLKADQFLRSFKQRNRRTPSIEWPAMQSYDATNILIAAIKQAYSQNGNFTDNMRNALLQVSNYPGSSGNITIQQNGAARGIHPALYMYKNSKPEKVQKN
jgi:branched-chain amino acid transport system substrate-binding protein